MFHCETDETSCTFDSAALSSFKAGVSASVMAACGRPFPELEVYVLKILPFRDAYLMWQLVPDHRVGMSQALCKPQFVAEE